ncbi:hypothetical protein KKB44_03985 [Candidatus Micrarchaeota archaeon]|nr:hypothetical protein [Candidatus Micrarchaeota archaeon]
MAKKKPRKKKNAKKTIEETPKKTTITNEVRRIWLKVRKSWNVSHAAFSNTVSFLSEKEANTLYDIVKLGLYKDSYAHILHEHPELKEIVKSDDDRLCMYDIYEVLSWRLRRKEKMPKNKEIIMRMKGRIGREVPIFE